MSEDKFEVLELAVKEQAEELIKASQEIKELVTIINMLRNEVGGFSEKLNSQKITVEADTRPVQKIVDSAFSNMNFTIQRALEKKRSNNLQVFFESDAKKWAVILLVIVTFLSYLYNFGLHWLGK